MSRLVDPRPAIQCPATAAIASALTRETHYHLGTYPWTTWRAQVVNWAVMANRGGTRRPVRGARIEVTGDDGTSHAYLTLPMNDGWHDGPQTVWFAGDAGCGGALSLLEGGCVSMARPTSVSVEQRMIEPAPALRHPATAAVAAPGESVARWLTGVIPGAYGRLTRARGGLSETTVKSYRYAGRGGLRTVLLDEHPWMTWHASVSHDPARPGGAIVELWNSSALCWFSGVPSDDGWSEGEQTVWYAGEPGGPGVVSLRQGACLVTVA